METWPHVIGYWFRSCSIAATAACLTWSGAGKSGKPWARLIALCCSASLVISLITDSVSAAAVPAACPPACRSVMHPSWRAQAGLQPAHAAQPPVPVAGPALLVHGHLGVRQDQEALVADGLEDARGNVFRGQPAVHRGLRRAQAGPLGGHLADLAVARGGQVGAHRLRDKGRHAQ